MRCILFDLDGVLVDTRPMAAAALTYVARTLGVPNITEHDRLAAAALSPRRAVQRFFPASPVALDIFQACVRLNARTLVPCPGVVDLLEALRKEQLGVVTSRNQADATLYLDASGLRHYFPVVVTWGTTTRRKPYPDPLFAAARKLGVHEGVYVGDTPDDMRAAVRARFRGLGALWASVWSASDLLHAGAAYVVDDPSGILAYLNDKE